MEVNDREKLIIRQSSMKAAARIVAAKGGELMDIAEKIEKWILR